ncbi:hypothetical protein [Roseovarius salinarum]|uniref:hypothetical protein n=1 Tax=Roseovarius salinarum TaxID=1981892 RepID=UPI000C346CB0|nr:hypothetical protein [Roseovarius salinarum]
MATYCYPERLFDRGVRALNHEIVRLWRRRFGAIPGEIRTCFPPKSDVDPEAQADMASTVIEGALVPGRATGESRILPAQIMLYRHCTRHLFLPGPRA